MKIERPHCEASELQAVALAGSANPSAASFATALRRHREQEASNREGLRRSEATSSGRAVPRAAARADAGQRSANRLLDAMLDASSGFLIEGGPPTAPRRTLPDAVPSLAAIVANELRRRRVGHEGDSGPCIEVMHSSTGVSLLLSRENGVWLVSFQAQPCESPVDHHLILEALRAYFVEHELGPIDVIPG
jgi:hypothetical protein